MSHNKYIPEGILKSYVRCFWYGRDYRPSGKVERVLPNGDSQLIINLGSEKFRHFEGSDGAKERSYGPAIIAGVHTRNIFLDSFSRRSTIHAVLRPGALQALFDIPADEFKNQITALELVAGPGILSLRDKLIETDARGEKFNLMENFLRDRLDHTLQPNPAIIFSQERIKEKNGCLSVERVRDKTGYSHRRFSELFKRHVGITPKHYARICRFQHTLDSIRGSKTPNWISIALNSGYYDQSHFIHEFKAFSGISPTEYYLNQNEEINHITV